MTDPLDSIIRDFPVQKNSATPTPKIQQKGLLYVLEGVNNIKGMSLTPATNKTPKELKDAAMQGRVVHYHNGTFEAHEKHKKSLENAAKHGNLYLNTTNKAGVQEPKKLHLRNVRVISLSDSAYHARIDHLIRDIIREKEIEQSKIDKTMRGEEKYWYEEAKNQGRVKDETNREATTTKPKENLEAKMTKRVNGENRLNEERAKKVDEFVRQKVDTQIEIIEAHEENRREAVKFIFGIPSKPPTLRQLDSHHVKRSFRKP